MDPLYEIPKMSANLTELLPSERIEQDAITKAKLKASPLEERQPDIDQNPQWFDVETHTTDNVVLHTTKTYIKQCNTSPNTALGAFVSFVRGDRYNGSEYVFANATIYCPPGDVMGHITMVAEHQV